jgi:hypothetical protein
MDGGLTRAGVPSAHAVRVAIDVATRRANHERRSAEGAHPPSPLPDLPQADWRALLSCPCFGKPSPSAASPEPRTLSGPIPGSIPVPAPQTPVISHNISLSTPKILPAHGEVDDSLGQGVLGVGSCEGRASEGLASSAGTPLTARGCDGTECGTTGGGHDPYDRHQRGYDQMEHVTPHQPGNDQTVTPDPTSVAPPRGKVGGGESGRLSGEGGAGGNEGPGVSSAGRNEDAGRGKMNVEVLEPALWGRVQRLVAELAVRNPQDAMEGCRNIWIVKPAGRSRGRGIFCSNDIRDVRPCSHTFDLGWVWLCA